MFRKMMLVICMAIVGLTVFTLPVSAQGKGPKPPLPPQAKGWSLDITVFEPSYYEQPIPGEILWSFTYHVTMPPVSWPVQVVMLREGVLMSDYTATFYYGDPCMNFTAPVWEVDPPDSVTYTFVLTSQSKTITQDVVIYFD